MTQARITSCLSVVTVLLLGILSVVAPADSDGPASGSVAGKTVDADGIGVEGVEVGVYGADPDDPIASSVTAAEGTFIVKNVPPGDSLFVRAFHKGHPFDQSAEKAGVAVTADHATDVGSLELKIVLHHHKKPATTAAATQP